MNFNTVQTILDENGQITGVIVPIELWREMRSDVETTYLLKSEVMKQRLILDVQVFPEDKIIVVK